MELPVAVIIFVIALIVLALAVYLVATIAELRRINGDLYRVLDGVGQIATKTAPVNGVLDAINGTLAAGRDLLEGLALKKAGSDAAGLVESCYPGEGQRFLQRIGRSGAVVAIGEDYGRGAAILNSLLGAGPAPPSPSAAPAPTPPPAPATSAPAGNGSGGRITLRTSSPPATPAAPDPAVGAWAGRGGGGRISLRTSRPPAEPETSAPGRLSARSSRPWE